MMGWSLDIEALVEECGEKIIFFCFCCCFWDWAWWTYTKQISEGQKGISKVDNEWSQM